MITSQPRHGRKILVRTPTTIHAILQFHSGAQVTCCASRDVWQHGHAPMEFFGAEGTLHLPDPNFFGGKLRMTRRAAFTNVGVAWDHPFARPNDGAEANYRAARLANMAQAGDAGQVLDLTTSCARPAPLPPDAAADLLRQPACGRGCRGGIASTPVCALGHVLRPVAESMRLFFALDL